MDQGRGIPLPPGIQVARMGRRAGAWILDGLLVGLLMLIPMILAVVSGAVSLNQQALDQFDAEAYDPFANVTAPLLRVNTGLLVIAVAVYVAIQAAYYAGSWTGSGGTPCQRGLKLRVVDVASGRYLSFGMSLLRWLLLQGLSLVIGSVFFVVLLGNLATTPANQLFSPYHASIYGAGANAGTGLASALVSWASLIWIVILIVSAGTNPARRGLHDRIVGSIVVSPVQFAPVWPGYASPLPQWPGYPPQLPQYPPPSPAYPSSPSPYAQPTLPDYPPPPVPPAAPTQPAPGDGRATELPDDAPNR
jgi:uncharacterized RDD family membrane protein YckC